MNPLTRKKILLYLTVIFIAGGVSGGAIVATSNRQHKVKQPSMGNVCDHFRKKLQTRLELTPGQMLKIDPILTQTGRDLEAIHSRSIEQVEQVIQKSNAEIARELTPEQRVKMEAMEKERRDFMQKRSRGKRENP